MIELVLGGARSGKSRFAEQRAAASDLEVVYIATATVGDTEMAARIEHHQRRRPADWHCIEEPLCLAARLASEDRPGRLLLVDCLTLWTCNALFDPATDTWETQRSALMKTLPCLQARVILVSNETGWGVVPMGAETRRYVDELGRLHQDVAALAQRVVMVVAGLPLYLKGS